MDEATTGSLGADLERHARRVYSQGGEDGVLLRLFLSALGYALRHHETSPSVTISVRTDGGNVLLEVKGISDGWPAKVSTDSEREFCEATLCTHAIEVSVPASERIVLRIPSAPEG